MRNTEPELTSGLDSETYRALFRLVRDAIILEKHDQTIVDANPAAETLFGYSLDELMGLKTSDLIFSEGNRETPHHVYSDPETGDKMTFQTEVVSKAGLVFPVEITISPLKSKEGWLFLSIIRDISGFKDAEKALKQAQAELENQVAERTKDLTAADEQIVLREQRYRSLVEGSLQGIAILEGPPFKFTFTNEAGSRTIGYSSEELLSFNSDDVEAMVHWTDRPRILKYIGEILGDKRKSVRTEARFNKRSNEVIWLDLSMTGVKIEGSTSLIATFIDISEQRKGLADLMDSRRDLEIFASLLRHDLRNDLQVITGNTEVMRLSAPDNEMVQQFAEANVAGVRRMLELLKIFGRPEKERERMITPILENLSVEATKTHVGLICQLHIDPEALMVRVVGGIMLPMVFQNLINNSAKHAGEKPRVDIRVKRSQEFIEVRVSDNGPGIPDSIKEKLFEKGVSTTGGGLGLYLSKKVVEAYGGSIQLMEPENPKEGAIFLVKLGIASGGLEEITTT
jgi:PAS domain S-box-containing protein